MSELFPTAVRYSGSSLAVTLASVCGGAVAPIVATYLFALTGTVEPDHGVHGGHLDRLVALRAGAARDVSRQPVAP
jgi:hypothetical protein